MSRARTPRPGGRASTSSLTRAGKAGDARDETAIPIDDEQLIGVESSAPATVTIAVLAADPPTLAQIQTAADSLGHAIVAVSVGGVGLERLLAALSTDAPPAVVVLAASEVAPVLTFARRLSPPPVIIYAASGSPANVAEQSSTLRADMYAIAPFVPDRLAPILLAAGALAATRAELHVARGTELLLRRRLDQLVSRDDETGFHSFELFQRVLEIELRRARRFDYSLSLAVLELIGPRRGSDGVGRILRVRAGAALTSSIRDIDLATELDDGRYLVLLPYTDRTGAGQVAHRIVREIAALPAITMGGTTQRATARAGVAGGEAGPMLSFARLMKDATAALAIATRDDAELVVWT